MSMCRRECLGEYYGAVTPHLRYAVNCGSLVVALSLPTVSRFLRETTTQAPVLTTVHPHATSASYFVHCVCVTKKTIPRRSQHCTRRRPSFLTHERGFPIETRRDTRPNTALETNLNFAFLGVPPLQHELTRTVSYLEVLTLTRPTELALCREFSYCDSD